MNTINHSSIALAYLIAASKDAALKVTPIDPSEMYYGPEIHIDMARAAMRESAIEGECVDVTNLPQLPDLSTQSTELSTGLD